MLRSITSKQFLEWEAYHALDPFGEIRADYRAASIACVIANVNRAKGQRQFTIKDFLLNFGEGSAGKQTWQEKKAIAMMWAQAFGASVTRAADIE